MHEKKITAFILPMKEQPIEDIYFDEKYGWVYPLRTDVDDYDLIRVKLPLTPGQKFMVKEPWQKGLNYGYKADYLDLKSIKWKSPASMPRDAVIRLPGESEGADRECQVAMVNGIPVFTDITELKLFIN